LLRNATTTTYDNVSLNYSYDYISGRASGYTAINSSMTSLYDFGVGFLGIIILVTMVWLIIKIVSGTTKRRN